MNKIFGKYGDIVLFTLIGLGGLFTWLQSIDLKAILFPLVCHVPATAQIVADDCTGKIIEFAGKWVAITSGAALFIGRAVAWITGILTAIKKE